MTDSKRHPAGERPDVSFIVPCYDEEEVIPYTIPALARAFAGAGIDLELVCVDNGSRDRTGEILRELQSQGHPIVVHRIEVNQGYGHGVLEAIPLCRAPWVGIIPADGQVDAEDVVKLFEAVRHTSGYVIGKVRRRFRMDGLRRKIVSIAYNALVTLLWPRIGTIDVNGSPKIIQRDLLERLELSEREWFLDPEMMIKAQYLGTRVIEVNVFARMRSNGLSHVRASTCWEFLRDLIRYRFGGPIRAWRRRVAAGTAAARTDGAGRPDAAART